MRSRKPKPHKGLVPAARLLAAVLVIPVLMTMPACGGNAEEDGAGSSPAATSDGHAHGGGTSEKTVEEQLWTCSMHPDIKLKEPGKCPICFMDLIPLETDEGESLDPRQLRMTASAAALASIETVPVRRGKAFAERRLFGTVIPDETRVARITSRIAGRLDRLFVEYTGAFVTEGGRLAEIYSPELLRAQEELIQAAGAVRAGGSGGSEFLERSAGRNLEAAREKLLLYGLSADQIEAVENSGRVSDHLVIRSPVTGTVISKEAVEGMYVSVGTPIYTVADLSSVWIDFRAYQSDLVWLRAGQQVGFVSESIPGTGFGGRIIFIDPVLDAGTRTAGVRVEADNPDGRLKPDMFVSGTVHAALYGEGGAADPQDPGESSPLLIPATAALLTGERAVVYVRLPGDGDPVFEGREVVLGPRAGESYVVMSGLAEGEQVVVNGAFKIDSELQIRARPSMMTGSMKERADERPGGGRSIPRAAELALFKPVYDAYFDVQMALASDDLEAAKKGGSALKSAAGGIDPGALTGSLAGDWKRLSKDISESAGRVSTAGDIAACRGEFDILSGLMIEMHEAYGHSGSAPYFLTFCPMANSNKGAFWLQEVDTVYNSHYGSMMLRCGEIRERLEPRGK